jgi:flagellar basal-body rod protein FlgF
MENAQLISLSRQIALQRQMDVVANNMANINTSGFKNEMLLFEEFEMPVARDQKWEPNDQFLSYTQDWATIHDHAPGAFTQTGNMLDVALQGDGFFTIQTPAGERFTRNGEFKLDNNGRLVTNDGHAVLSEGGELQFEATETNISIDAQGNVLTDAGNKGRLKIVSFDNPQALTREGANLFGGELPIADIQTQAIQGSLERSNVSGVTEMATMIRVTRAYQSLAQIMQRQDEMRRSAIQKLGSLQG